MKILTRRKNLFQFLLLGLMCLTVGAVGGRAQEDESKSITSDEFVSKRPSSGFNSTPKPGRPKPPVKPKPKPKPYTRKPTPQPKAKVNAPLPAKPPVKIALKDADKAVIGVTMWRFRPSKKGDATKELLEEGSPDERNSTEYTLERIEADTKFKPNDKIRLSIESLSHDGYLYIINREQYADGTFGKPMLIFPTLRHNDGDNFVKAGVLSYIPPAPRYFRIVTEASENPQIAEVLTIIVSPMQLVEPSSLEMKAIEISPEKFAEWEEKWSVEVSRFEQDKGAGGAMTLVEQEAGTKRLEEGSLKQDDPLPQTVYRMKVKKGNPALVTVPLQFVGN